MAFLLGEDGRVSVFEIRKNRGIKIFNQKYYSVEKKGEICAKNNNVRIGSRGGHVRGYGNWVFVTVDNEIRTYKISE